MAEFLLQEPAARRDVTRRLAARLIRWDELETR
jgi:hypothetical protein